jgi:hypothetical protein
MRPQILTPHDGGVESADDMDAGVEVGGMWYWFVAD